MNNSAKGVVTLCRLENGQVEIILGIPGACDHHLFIPIPTAETEPPVAPSASSSSSVDVTVENYQHSKTHQAERSEMLPSTHYPFERTSNDTMDIEINYALQPESTTGDVMDMDINRPQHWPISSPNGPSRVNSGNDNGLEDDLCNRAMNSKGKLHDPFLPLCGVISPAMSSGTS